MIEPIAAPLIQLTPAERNVLIEHAAYHVGQSKITINHRECVRIAEANLIVLCEALKTADARRRGQA